MKKEKFIKRVVSLILAALILTASLTACDSTQTDSEGNNDPDARTITVCAAPGFYPITYADDNGNAAGYDVEVFKAIDELLPQYEFVYELADKETMNVGVQTGTYQVGINMLFWTEERAETYLIPEQNMGNATIGLIYREDIDEPITSFQDVYDRGLSIFPTSPVGGIAQVVTRWNEANPDAQVEIELTTGIDGVGLESVRAGEYDLAINIIQVYNLYSEEARAGLVVSDPVDVIHTYPIINKNETELYEAIQESLTTLYESGKLSEISMDVFGYDVFELQ